MTSGEACRGVWLIRRGVNINYSTERDQCGDAPVMGPGVT